MSENSNLSLTSCSRINFKGSAIKLTVEKSLRTHRMFFKLFINLFYKKSVCLKVIFNLR